MTFELVHKETRGRNKILPNEVSVTGSRILFGEAISFEGMMYCELYLDKKNLLLGFKPSNDNVKGFKVREEKGTRRIILAINFASKIPKGRYVIQPSFGEVPYVIKLREITVR